MVPCPNCGAAMRDGASCPKCEHDEHGPLAILECHCPACREAVKAAREANDGDDWMFGGFTPGDYD